MTDQSENEKWLREYLPQADETLRAEGDCYPLFVRLRKVAAELASQREEIARLQGSLERECLAHLNTKHYASSRVMHLNVVMEVFERPTVSSAAHSAAKLLQMEIMELRAEIARLKDEGSALQQWGNDMRAMERDAQATIAALRAERDAPKAAAEKGTEYVLAQINEQLRDRIAEMEKRLRESA